MFHILEINSRKITVISEMRLYLQVKIKKKSYVFECCCDSLCFVLVLQVLVCNLKDTLLFFPLLFVLCHVSCVKRSNKRETMNFISFLPIHPVNLFSSGALFDVSAVKM